MADLYNMTAWNTNLLTTVHWPVENSPDHTGVKSPYPSGDLQDIIEQKPLGTRQPLKVRRGGMAIELRVSVKALPAAEKQPAYRP